MQRRPRQTIGFGMLFAVVSTIGLAGCINPSEQIATSLARYGLDERQARCVGDRLEANLSINQLRQLGRAASEISKTEADRRKLTIGDLIDASSQFEDIKVPIEVAKAAARCGVLTGVSATLPSS